MARRSLLSTHDSNVPLSASNAAIAGDTRSTSLAASKPAKGLGSSRPSMIPRQSMLPTRVPSGSENMMGAPPPPGRSTAGPRYSLAVGMVGGMGYPGLGGSTAMDADFGGPSINSTPHRAQMLNTRRVESVGRMSAAPTPNTRRSLGGRQSLAPRAGQSLKALQVADPRPIREDRQLLMRMEAEVQDFLADTGFVFPAKYSGEFHMPSQVLVMTAFRHIYHQCIDVKYLFVAEPKKEVEEVMQLMSDIKYPLLGDLSKTKLSAPGSIHNWPPICGMLHWILCIKNALEVPTTKYHGGPLERPVSDDDEDFCHYFPYLWLCYEQFWDSKDEYPEERAKLEEIFEEKSRQARRELEQLREEELQLSSRLKYLHENDSPLKVEEGENKVLESDVKKFVDYKREALEPRILQYETGVETFSRESGRHEERIERLQRERDGLQNQVDAQNVSSNEFEQMSRQREILADQLRTIMAKFQEQSSSNNHMEVSLSNKQSHVEDDLKDLADKCRDLGMFPFMLADGRQLFDFDVVAGNASTMLPMGLDLRVDLRRRISEKRDGLAARYREAVSAKIKDQEDFDAIMEEVEEKREEVARLETRLRSIKEQTDLAQAAGKEEARIQAEVEASNEMALAQVDQAGRSAVDQAESRLQSARLQINLVRDRDDQLREELHQDFVAGLETILSLKSLVTEGLKELEEASMALVQ